MGPAYSLASTMGPMVAAAGFFAPRRCSPSLRSCSASRLASHVFRFIIRTPAHHTRGSRWRSARLGSYGAWLLLLSNFFATMAMFDSRGNLYARSLNPGRAQSPLWDAAVGGVWILGSAILLYAGVRPTVLVTAALLMFELLVLAASAVAAALHPSAAVARPAADFFGADRADRVRLPERDDARDLDERRLGSLGVHIRRGPRSAVAIRPRRHNGIGRDEHHLARMHGRLSAYRRRRRFQRACRRFDGLRRDTLGWKLLAHDHHRDGVGLNVHRAVDDAALSLAQRLRHGPQRHAAAFLWNAGSAFRAVLVAAAASPCS